LVIFDSWLPESGYHLEIKDQEFDHGGKKMAAWKYRGYLAGLLFVAVSCTGCNLMALPFFLIPGMEPKHEARCKLTPHEKDKEVKVVILSSSGLETRPEFLRVDRELSRLLYQHLEEGFKKNKEKVTLVAVSQVEKYKDEHPNWHSLSPAEIGKHFNADYVIDLEINAVTLYEQGSANTLFRGHAEISIDVVDVYKPTEGPIYREEYTVDYPRARGPIPASEGNVPQFRQRFLSVIARELSWRFTAHLVEDDFRMND
jgi:hypothetical protein